MPTTPALHDRRLGCLLAVAVLFAPAPPVRAQQQPAAPAAAKDTLVFTNGDQLQGTLEKAEGDSITFKSDMAGEITVKLSTIKELRSASDFAVLLKSAKPTRVPAVLGKVEVEEGKLTVARPQQPVATIPSDQLGYIVAATDYEKALVNTHAPFEHWNGAVTGGATLVRATQNGTTLTAAATLVRLAPGVPYLPAHSRTTVDLSESYGKLTTPIIPQTVPPSPPSSVKTNIFHADAEYDRYFSPRLYALADLAFDHNFAQGLQLQQIYGGGLGYTAILEPYQELDLKGELHYEKQHFIGSVGDQNLIGGSFGENYRRNLPYKVIFTETGVFIPAFNNTNAYSANLGVALALPAYKRLSVALSATDDYLNNPPVGYKKNSFQFVTGITYTLR